MNEQFPLALPIGTVLAGQYIIEKILGQGGFGITYCVKDHKTDERYAIKEFFPDIMATRTQTMVVPYSGERGDNFTYGKECFLQEAETLAKFIGNEGIVRIHSYFEENGTAYYVMDYVDGASLDEYIKEMGGSLSYDETLKIITPVMDALAIVHGRGIIHRDVTPDNIFITKDGTVKLLDFGAARYSLGDRSQSLDVVLKHGFAPKEQYVRRGKQGPFTDVYALAATFYYALTGKRPPDSIERIDTDELIPPSILGVKIPADAEEAILFALNVQPADRFQNMQAFKSALIPGGEAKKQSVTVQRFFTAPDKSIYEKDNEIRQIYHTSSQEHSQFANVNYADDKGANLYERCLAYIFSHRDSVNKLVFILFCLLALFHIIFAAKYEYYHSFTSNGTTYNRIGIIMAIPLSLLCIAHALYIRKDNTKHLRIGYIVGIAGISMYILFCFFFIDEPMYGIKNSYYGSLYAVIGLALYLLVITGFYDKIHHMISAVLYLLQSFGLWYHLRIYEIEYSDGTIAHIDTGFHAFLFSLVNAAAFILFLILQRKHEKA